MHCVHLYLHTQKKKHIKEGLCNRVDLPSRYFKQLFSEFSCPNGNAFFKIQVLDVY